MLLRFAGGNGLTRNSHMNSCLGYDRQQTEGMAEVQRVSVCVWNSKVCGVT